MASISTRLMTVNLVYLAAIAFVPFPTALAGQYTDDPVTIVIYAITLSVASGLDALMLSTSRTATVVHVARCRHRCSALRWWRR